MNWRKNSLYTCTAYILPVFVYGLVLWYHCNKYQFSRLDILHNNVARWILKQPLTFTFQRIISWLFLKDFIYILVSLFTHHWITKQRFIYSIWLLYRTTLLITYDQIENKLVHVRPNTDYLKQSIQCITATVWNQIPFINVKQSKFIYILLNLALNNTFLQNNTNFLIAWCCSIVLCCMLCFICDNAHTFCIHFIVSFSCIQQTQHTRTHHHTLHHPYITQLVYLCM